MVNRRAPFVRTVTESDFEQAKNYNGIETDPGTVVTLISHDFGDSEDLFVGIVRLGPGESRLKHHHTHASEVFVVTKGTFTIHLDGEEIEAGHRTAVYIPQNSVHALRNHGTEPAELIYAFNLPERSEHGTIWDEGPLAGGPSRPADKVQSE